MADTTEPPRRLRPVLGPLDAYDLALIGFLLATYLVVAFLPFQSKKYGDWDFHPEAKALAAFARGAVGFDQVGLKRAPGPSLYYAVPYLFVRPGSPDQVFWMVGCAWNTMWMGLALLLVRRSATRVAGALAGMIAGVLVIVSPFSAYYSYSLIAEPPAYLALTVFLHGWLRFQDTAETAASRLRGRRWGVLGMTLFLLCRPNGVLLLPLSFALAFLLLRRKTAEARAQGGFALRCAVWGTMIPLLAAGVVSLLPGRPETEPQGAFLVRSMFIGRFQLRDEPFDWRYLGWMSRGGSKDFRAYDDLNVRLHQQSLETGVPLDKLKIDWIVEDVVAHPGTVVQQIAVRTLFSQVTLVNSIATDKFRLGPLSGRTASVVFHVIVNITNVFLFGCAVVFVYQRRRTLAAWWPLWAPYLALFVFHVLEYMEARYLFPARSAVVVMAATVLREPVQGLLARFGGGRYSA